MAECFSDHAESAPKALGGLHFREAALDRYRDGLEGGGPQVR